MGGSGRTWLGLELGALALALLALAAVCGHPVDREASPIAVAAESASAASAATSAVAVDSAPGPKPPSLPVVPPAPTAARCDVKCAEDVGSADLCAPGPCPEEMAHIGRYCIDRWEAHLVVRATDGSVRAHPHYQRLRAGVRYEARSSPGVFPQGYISRIESQAACRAADKRLCRWLEWRRACQGPRWLRYPYGNEFVPSACNHIKEHLLGRFFGHDPRRWEQEDFNDPRLNQEPGFLEQTGEKRRCVSPEGVYDAVGNLHEWVGDQVSNRFMERLAEENVTREKQPWRPGNGMFLGGFYSTRAEHGPGCHFTTAAHGPSYHDYSTGFRCCRDARGSVD